MKRQIPDFNAARILIVGDVMLDRYFRGDTNRISPEAPIPVVHVRSKEERPGGAANVALNVNALGSKTSLMGMVGNDPEGDSLLNILQENGIHCDFQRTKIAPTITKLRIIGQNQQLLRVDFEENPVTFSIEKQRETYVKQLEKTDLVILSDYRKGTLQNSKELIALAKEKEIPVLIDPKQHSFEPYQGATLLTPNMKEFIHVVGPVENLEELEQKAREQLEKHDLGALLITRSAKGMSLIEKGQAIVNIPTEAKEVFDVTGAGDTVIATLACALAIGESMTTAMTLANAAAGISISKLGAATVTAAELHHAVNNQTLSETSIITKDQLKLLVNDAKSRARKVVMTNGCFDLLHAGHIAYLEEAKALGDYLIIAVNDDNSVKKLKGDTRPINSLEHRMTMLAGLQSVDWVVPFSEDTPEKLICEILPDILAKGGDYKPDDIAGGRCVTENGGKIEILCFKAGLSSSAIIEKIKET